MTMFDGRKSIASLAAFRAAPIRLSGIYLHICLRTLFAIFWLAAGIHKIAGEWMTTDIMLNIFRQRLTELHPDSFAVFYLQSFAMPLHKPVAWVVTIGELYTACGLLLGLTTRLSAAISFFILFNFAIGGYYDASLIPFFLLTMLFMSKPSGHWLGLDGYLHRRYPSSFLFR